VFERLIQKNTACTITVQVLSAADGISRLSGHAAAIQALINAASPNGLLRQGGGQASESVTVTEQGATGFYDITFTPTSGSGVGVPYLLVYREPSGIGAMERIEQYSIQVFDSITVTPAVGSYFTTLAALKEFGGWNGSGADALLTNLIARCTAEIQSEINRMGVSNTYTEFFDGHGSAQIRIRERPIALVTSLHESLDQVWDATTLVAAADYASDYVTGRIERKFGVPFLYGFQNIRVVYAGGWPTIPSLIENRCIRACARAFETRMHLGTSSVSLADGSTQTAETDMLNDDDRRALTPYADQVFV
jgi:hypothetical protein